MGLFTYITTEIFNLFFLPVHAGGEFTDGTTTIGIFGGIQDLLSKITSDLSTLAYTIGALAVVACGIGYAMSGNDRGGEKFKNWGFRIAIGLIVVYSAQKIIESIKNASTTTTMVRMMYPSIDKTLGVIKPDSGVNFLL